jgi:competence protein ComEA
MLKKLLAIAAMLYAAASFAAVEVNKATAAELDGIKGIGPGISGKILDERKKGNFKDWNDLITRVNGVGDTNAAKYSAEGLTVNGAAFAGAAPAAKKDDKPAAKKEEKAAAKEDKAAKKDDKPVAAAKEEKAAKKDEKPAAAAKEDKAAKKDEKAAAKDDKKAAKADAKSEAKEAKADKKEAKKEEVAKADAAKPAASAPKK